MRRSVLGGLVAGGVFAMAAWAGCGGAEQAAAEVVAGTEVPGLRVASAAAEAPDVTGEDRSFEENVVADETGGLGTWEPEPPGPCDCPPPEPQPQEGRFTGGGSIFCGGQRITHGFELHCDADDPPNNLEVNWDGHQFHLESLETAVCSDDPNIAPRPPRAINDTYDGTGTGRLDQVDGASIVFRITDAGEPGTGDLFRLTITDVGGTEVLDCEGFLLKGNHQSHEKNTATQNRRN